MTGIPFPTKAVVCDHCQGHGVEPHRKEGMQHPMGFKPCRVCEGRRVLEAPATDSDILAWFEIQKKFRSREDK